MADIAELEERLRRLEQSREALACEVGYLRSKEAERERKQVRRKEIDAALWPFVIVLAILCYGLLGYMAIKGPPNSGSSSSGFVAYPRPGG